ncbi:phytanoyl-CoA dioxygenase family protein [Aquihabitans sp. McL0605]|uniref:phytanoyl-CoA dioxygenase family protein n=1 Tax=Aquihabitans sp. McL0605 TaxID=3415671 RepID=UPI003CF3D834
MQIVPVHRHGTPGWADAVAADLQRNNVATASGVLDPDRVEELRGALDAAIEQDARWIPEDRLAAELGRVLFLPVYGEPFLRLLDDGPIYEPAEPLLGRDSHLYTMTSALTGPGEQGRPLHRDSALAIDGFLAALGLMILLDDFDEASGGTRFHPEVTAAPPTPEDFEHRALRLVAPAGSVCWFHGAAWHDSTRNTTDHPRRCIIAAVSRPWIRQRFDMPTILEHLEPGALSTSAGRRLGFDQLAPGSYEEYYATPAGRRAAVLARSKPALRSGPDRSSGPGASLPR